MGHMATSCTMGCTQYPPMSNDETSTHTRTRATCTHQGPVHAPGPHARTRSDAMAVSKEMMHVDGRDRMQSPGRMSRSATRPRTPQQLLEPEAEDMGNTAGRTAPTVAPRCSHHLHAHATWGPWGDH